MDVADDDGRDRLRLDNLCVRKLYEGGSSYRSSLVLDLVSKSPAMGYFGAAYRCLVEVNDMFCAKTAIKEYVLACCSKKQMAPILSRVWQSKNTRLLDEERRSWSSSCC